MAKVTMDATLLAEKLLTLRSKKGLSIHKLAAKAVVSVNTIYRLEAPAEVLRLECKLATIRKRAQERKDASPNLAVLTAIATALDVTISELLK